MLKMIIVDDEHLILEGLQKLIDWTSVGVEVVGIADNGAAAVDLTLKQQPDIILSDISMPFFSGLQMLETLRKNAVTAEVIFISAYSKFEYAKEALIYGAFDYISKPINEQLLLETVARCAEKIRKMKSIRPRSDEWIQNIQTGNSQYYDQMMRYSPDETDTFESVRHALLKAVKSADTTATATELLRFFSIIYHEDDILDADTVKLHCIELLDFILRELAEYKLQDSLDTPQKALNAKKSITLGANLDDVFRITLGFIDNITLYGKEILAHGSKRLVRLAVGYIHEHYKNDVSLSQTAEALYISAAYLSKIFSAEMGEPFSHYLLKYRIAMAKKLLRGTHLKIYEIVAEVGYNDVAHFSKSFKQITGITPIRYRQMPRE